MNSKSELFGIIGIMVFALLVFAYILTGCNVTIVEIEKDALCEYLGHDDSHITWDGLVDGTGEYTTECVDYVPLKQAEERRDD